MATRRRASILLLLVLSVSAAGCIIVEFPMESGAGLPPTFPPAPDPIPTPASHAEDRGDLRTVWPEDAGAYQPYLEAARGEDGVDEWVDVMNRELALPQDIRVRHQQCGMQNAYYDPATQEVTMCWELLDLIGGVMSDPRTEPEHVQRAIGSAWLFVLFHEIGHSLVDVYDLPVTGREEDAVDDLATLTLIDAGADEAAVEAALFWLLSDTGRYSDAQFADEHSLNPQRFYNILCTVYGSDPEEWSAIVAEGYLSRERGQRCVVEYDRKDASWERLLEPWRKV